ncbi:Elongation factor 1 alpha-like protein [Candida tropicalis]
MDYDDDDLDYNSQGEEEEFDENKLNNEEYDLLHDMLPELKKKLKDYNDDISDYDLKEALYYNYFEIDPAIEELKSKFKKSTQPECVENEQKRRRLYDSIFHPITNLNLSLEKITKVKENFAKPSPDDVVLEAQKQAFEGVKNLKITPDQQQSKKPKETKPFKKIDIAKEIASSSDYIKPRKSFVVIGHVDAGKSTLMGRLLFDFGIVDAKTVNKLVKEAEKAGKGSFALAWVMDQTEEERSHGVTVDICATDFETSTTKFTAIDAPGHKDFVPQMIGGVSQADFALLVVDSISGEFEAGFALDGQTKEHTILAKNFGIEKICVAVNKMDKEDWNENRFDAIKTQMTEFLTGPDVEFRPDQIDFVPISGLTGNNVVKRDDSIQEFKWYNGPTLAQYIENVELEKTSDKVTSEPFFVSVHDVYKDKGELKVSGKISSGVISAGETIVALPSHESLQVQSLKVSKKPVDFAISGELTHFAFKTSHLENEDSDPIRIGDLLTKPGSPVKTVNKFIASLHLFNMDKPLLVGMPFVLFRNNTQVPARVSKIIEIVNSKKKKKKILHLVSRQTAIVEIELDGNKTLPLTKYEDNKILGRIVIRREGVTIGAGTVVDFSSSEN